MFYLLKTEFIDFNVKEATIDMYSSIANQQITVSYCIFQNLSVSSSGKAGAIFLSYFDSFLMYNNFIKCKCSNSVNNDAGNAIKSSYGNPNISHCLVDKCSEIKAYAESPVYVNSPTSLIAINSNFTNNIAQDTSSVIGSPSIECKGGKGNNLMEFCHVNDGKGHRAICYGFGRVLNTNIVKFEGRYILAEVNFASHCCFFENSLKNTFLDCKTIENCFTDNQNINKTTTVETKIFLIKNACWKKNELCTLCISSGNVQRVLFFFLLVSVK